MILRVDGSSLAISDCERRFKLTNIEGWTEKRPSFKAEWGAGFHIGVSSWLKSGKEARMHAVEEAAEYYNNSGCVVPEKDHRNDMFLQVCLAQYFKEYKNDDFIPLENKNGDIAVELPFAIPFMKIGNIEVLLCGMMDAIGEYNGRPVVIKDIKTTNRVFFPGVFDDYFQAIQFPIYAWVAKQLGICDYYPSIVIDGVFIAGGKCILKRSDTYQYVDDVIEDVMDWARRRVRHLVHCYVEDDWSYNFSKCKAAWGTCEFALSCSVSRGRRKQLIERSFVQRVYDPRTFNTNNI